VSATETETSTPESQQAPVIKLEVIPTEDTTSQDATVSPISDEEEADKLVEPVVLSNGKPLKGILKHRRHSDTEGYLSEGGDQQKPAVAIRKLSSDNIIEGGTELSVDDELQSPQHSDAGADVVDSIAAHSG